MSKPFIVSQSKNKSKWYKEKNAEKRHYILSRTSDSFVESQFWKQRHIKKSKTEIKEEERGNYIKGRGKITAFSYIAIIFIILLTDILFFVVFKFFL